MDVATRRRAVDRRAFFGSVLAAAAAGGAAPAQAAGLSAAEVARLDRGRVLRAADRALGEPPRTITAYPAPRSPGGPHDYYSEGDYWWPDPQHPGGPYIQRDGYSNPDRFDAHRQALIRLSLLVPALAAAWKLTGARRYAGRAGLHLRAWFVDPATRMAPNLDHAQAILGRNTGRGIGVIDTLQLVEVARAIAVLAPSGALSPADQAEVAGWFRQYLDWLQRSPNGLEEKAQKNNHGSCWVLQTAAFARLVGDEGVEAAARERFRTVLVPEQIEPDGRQPRELARTKPYSYCLFNLEVLSALCQVLSRPGDDLWRFTTPDGRGVAGALAWMAPFIADKRRWPLRPDVEYFDQLPVRETSLLFGGLALDRPDYLELWRRLDPDPKGGEIIRNFPLRQPVLWVE